MIFFANTLVFWDFFAPVFDFQFEELIVTREA